MEHGVGRLGEGDGLRGGGHRQTAQNVGGSGFGLLVANVNRKCYLQKSTSVNESVQNE